MSSDDWLDPNSVKARKAVEESLNSDGAESLLAKLKETFPDKVNMYDWLFKPNEGLGGLKPATVILVNNFVWALEALTKEYS